MKAQEYYIVMREEQRDYAEPAQLIYSGNDSDVIVGFISEVDTDNSRMRFTLFEPLDFSEFMMDVVEELSDEEVRLRLIEALDANPAMASTWEEILDNSISAEV